MSWLRDLGRELDAVGIHGRARGRIVAELADHLACEPASEERLGSPASVAERFAAELRIVRTRRAAYGSFGALVLVAVGMFATQLAFDAAGGWPTVTGIRGDYVVPFAGLVILIAPQIAFVAGMLGIARMLRIRRRPVPELVEYRLVQRRMAIADLAAGLCAMAMLVHVGALGSLMPWWWTAVALPAAVLPLLALGVAGVTVRGAVSLTPAGAGGPPAEGLLADIPDRLAPFAKPLLDRAWLLVAVVGAPVVAVMLVVTAHAERSFQEGAIRAVFEAVAFVACFAALGRLLGIRR